METIDQVIDIKETERTVIVGRTGSGKTLLARSLLTQYPYVLVIDEKAEFWLPNAHIVRELDDLPSSLNELINRPYEPIIYQPEPDYWNIASYNEVFNLVYIRRHMTVYVDEIYAVMKGLTFPDRYQAVLTRGRTLEIRTISSTQRPSRIPMSVLSEADHYIVFWLQMLEDRDRMASLIGREVMQDPKNPHSFFYYRIGQTGPPVEYIMEERSVSRILSWSASNEHAVFQS